MSTTPRHSVHVRHYPIRDEPVSISFAFRPAPAASYGPEWTRSAPGIGWLALDKPAPVRPKWLYPPELCSHGLAEPNCPDCDVPSYLPSVLEGDTEPEGNVYYDGSFYGSLD